jgi:hypothetical protein
MFIWICAGQDRASLQGFLETQPETCPASHSFTKPNPYLQIKRQKLAYARRIGACDFCPPLLKTIEPFLINIWFQSLAHFCTKNMQIYN